MTTSLYAQSVTALTRLHCRIRHRPRFLYLKELRRAQNLSGEEVQRLQEGRLRRLLEHAQQDSPYYQDLFRANRIDIRDIKTVGDLRHLPYLTRQDLQQHSARILARSARDVYRNASGGSTGEPVIVYQDAYYKEYGEALYLLFLSWAGVSLGDRTAAFWGSDRDLRSVSRAQMIYNRVYRRRVHNSFSSSEADLDAFMRGLAVWQPQFMFGYASSLDAAARRAQALGIHSISPKAIRSAAELLSSPQRRRIERAFQAPVLDFYGSREVNNVAAQCRAQQGLHVMAPGRIVEVESDSSERYDLDPMGRILVTDLTNFAFPLIRYQNGDRGRVDDRPCPCGCSWPRLKDIGGRTSDTLHIRGRRIHGEFFTHLFYGYDNVQQFQVIQTGPSRLQIRIKAYPRFSDFSRLESRIFDQVGGPIEIEFIEVSDIEVASSGKQRFVINAWDERARGLDDEHTD